MKSNFYKRGLSILLTLIVCLSMMPFSIFAEETIDNEYGTDIAAEITDQVRETENGQILTETSITVNESRIALEKIEKINDSETGTVKTDTVETTEQITAGRVEITTALGQEEPVDISVSEAAKPDTSGYERIKNDNGSKTEEIENGEKTITVTGSKDDKGNDVYTTETVTATTVTEPISFEVPEECTVINDDGSRTTVIIEKDGNGTSGITQYS